MGERTEWDDILDDAIGELIDEDTVGFRLTVEKDDGFYSMTFTREGSVGAPDFGLLAVFKIIDEQMMLLDQLEGFEGDINPNPYDVVDFSGVVAASYGLIDEEGRSKGEFTSP